MSAVEEKRSHASISNLSWEHVDQVLELERSIRKCHMRHMTCSRRSFAFTAIYKFLFDYLTERRSVRGDEWCPAAASRNLLLGVEKCIKVLEDREEHYRLMLDHYLQNKIRQKHTRVNPLLVASRHTELADPDKKIWKRMYDAGIAPSKVIDAYEEVKRLLPNEAVANYEIRTGEVNCLVDQSHCRIVCDNTTKTCGDTMAAEHLTCTPREFYDRYMRSDIVVAKSNKISEAFSENYEILPGKVIRVPRRIERYLNVEMERAVKNSTSFLTNYIRGIVVAYSVGDMFGVAFPATQLYLMAFGQSASAACGEYVLGSSFTRLKGFLISRKLFSVPIGDSDYNSKCFSGYGEGRSTFPDSLSATKYHKTPRDLIVGSLNYMPDRKVKSAVAHMRSPVAEHEPDGYMAVWLALAVSRVLGRGVSANYAILFLANWAARQYQRQRTQISEQKLLRLFVSVGLTFEKIPGMVVPVVGFGSGMTNSKLKRYGIYCMRNFIKKLLDSGRPVMESTQRDLSDMSLEQLSARLFKNNGAVTLSTSSGEDDTALERTLESMRGEEFIPSEERRQIHEEEYNKTLNRELKLRLRFGVCGYQHPLPASGNKNSLVKLQLLKHRKTYVQRETAAAINWDRLLQFFFPRRSSLARPEIVGPHTTRALSRLRSLSRHFVEFISIALKSALPCERSLDDIDIKFNSDILTLGKKPDLFLRQKAGLVIGQHAIDALEVAYHHLDRFAESRGISNVHLSELTAHSDIGRAAIAMAHGCVTARDHQQQYSKCQSFIPNLKDTSFEPIPFYGIENPIFPPKGSYDDKTAIKCNEIESEFWVRETNGHMIDALLSRGILSLPKLEANRKRDSIILESNACVDLYRSIGRLNHKELISDKPRKSDPTPWSSKNTGQAGRSVTEFSPNSIIVLSVDCNLIERGDTHIQNVEKVRGNNGVLFEVGGVDDVFLAAVETQYTMAQNDILYPERKTVSRTGKTFSMIKAPDISPVFRHGGKPAVITLRHGSCQKAGVRST
uniref:Wsv192-like protein n=1 Tax=Trachysalambria curvirostris nimavirus TaxID=2984282 RepID=A0A9C7BWW5_9VIRU|nr:MAG: wsv192-like protein [Trachysalambria curvirostris nimavirus]